MRSHSLHKQYVVWQKSNETHFILTMNFIIFTNQGYPLQNSSLGQLHSDGGVVSIVRSSAGRLLPVYLSARRLHSSGYYPKYENGALSSGFWAGGIKRSHRDWDPANRGAEEPQECFFSAINSLMETAVWHGALSWCSIQVRALSGRTCAPLFLRLSRTSREKSLIDSVSWWHKFLVDDPLTVKNQMSIDLILDMLILAFLRRGEFAVCNSRIWNFVSGSYSKIHDSSRVITRLKNSGSLSRRSRRSRHISLRLAFCSVVKFFGTILAHTFLMSKPCVKIWWKVNRFKFNSLLIILNVNRRSDLTRDLTLSTFSSVFRFKFFPHEVRLPLVLGLLKRTCAHWTFVLWIRNGLHKPFVTSHKSQ